MKYMTRLHEASVPSGHAKTESIAIRMRKLRREGVSLFCPPPNFHAAEKQERDCSHFMVSLLALLGVFYIAGHHLLHLSGKM